MNKEVRNMLENVYRIFKHKYSETFQAWNNFIEFLLIDNSETWIKQLERIPEWLVKEDAFIKKAIMNYDAKLIRSDYYDHLGDMYFTKFNLDRTKHLQSVENIALFADMNIRQTNLEIGILDPSMKTGRYLMAIHKIAPKSVLFGVESDIQLLRIAYVNFAIHGIQAYVLHANSNIHEIELDKDFGIYNWQYMNNWNSCIDKMKKKISILN